MEEKIFKNLEDENLKRRKITILKQTGNVIEADVEFAGEIDSEATPITAEIMNEFQQNIKNAVSRADKFEGLAEGARIISNEAKEIAEEALEQVVEKQGTKVYEHGELVSAFYADKKLSTVQGETNSNKILVTDENGVVEPSNIIPLGNGTKLYTEIDENNDVSLIFETLGRE